MLESHSELIQIKNQLKKQMKFFRRNHRKSLNFYKIFDQNHIKFKMNIKKLQNLIDDLHKQKKNIFIIINLKKKIENFRRKIFSRIFSSKLVRNDVEKFIVNRQFIKKSQEIMFSSIILQRFKNNSTNQIFD